MTKLQNQKQGDSKGQLNVKEMYASGKETDNLTFGECGLLLIWYTKEAFLGKLTDAMTER